MPNDTQTLRLNLEGLKNLLQKSGVGDGFAKSGSRKKNQENHQANFPNLLNPTLLDHQQLQFLYYRQDHQTNCLNRLIPTLQGLQWHRVSGCFKGLAENTWIIENMSKIWIPGKKKSKEKESAARRRLFNGGERRGVDAMDGGDALRAVWVRGVRCVTDLWGPAWTDAANESRSVWVRRSLSKRKNTHKQHRA
uniref:Uncharacterized protein n=1 Tax=Oryza punctata TaxID=4537 RepID=A0A0E0MA98_ORYPU